MKFDPENLPEFKMPTNLLDKVFDLSGDREVGKGVLVAYLTQDGSPVIYMKTNSKIVDMGLRKAMETYLDEAEAQALGGLDFVERDDIIDRDDEDEGLQS